VPQIFPKIQEKHYIPSFAGSKEKRIHEKTLIAKCSLIELFASMITYFCSALEKKTTQEIAFTMVYYLLYNYWWR
jgi:hypothetical protein